MKLRKVSRPTITLDKIFAEDCFDTMQRIGKGGVSIILTSPPYNTSKHTYTELSRSRHESRYDVYVDTGSHEDYIEWTKKLFSEFDRILCDNGVVLYNINYGTGYDNTCDNLIDIIHTITTKTPFMVADIIGWKKKSALPNNSSSNKCTRIFELVFVICRKTENKTFISNKGVKSTNKKTGQNFYENMFNFIEAPNNDGSCSLNKATFSSDLVFNLLKMYAGDKSGVVYDPFMGTGTTAVGALKFNEVYKRNYHYLGSELSKDQVKYAKSRIKDYECS